MEISNVWKWGIFVEIISEKEEDWWPLAFNKKSSGAMVGRRDSSQPLDNAEVTKQGVNLGTFDEKPLVSSWKHMFIFTFKYVDCEQCLGGCYSKKLESPERAQFFVHCSFLEWIWMEVLEVISPIRK